MNGQYGVSAARDDLSRDRPLILVDADEVIFRFVAGFEEFLRLRGLGLDLGSYRLHGNVKRQNGGESVGDREVSELLAEFRHDLDSLSLVDGANEALKDLSRSCAIVVLSNVSPLQGGARRRNLDSLGFKFPLVCNSGPKGAAAKALSDCAGRPVFFIDDIPQHLLSVADMVPDAVLIQLVGDRRLKKVLPRCQKAHLCTDSWKDAADFMTARLKTVA